MSELAEKALLPEEEVKIWISHLETVDANRKLGAQKAAATRHAKISSSHSRMDSSSISDCICGMCGDPYEEETDEVQNWIGCDSCDKWYHWECVGVTTEPDTFVCSACT